MRELEFGGDSSLPMARRVVDGLGRSHLVKLYHLSEAGRGRGTELEVLPGEDEDLDFDYLDPRDSTDTLTDEEEGLEDSGYFKKRGREDKKKKKKNGKEKEKKGGGEGGEKRRTRRFRGKKADDEGGEVVEESKEMEDGRGTRSLMGMSRRGRKKEERGRGNAEESDGQKQERRGFLGRSGRTVQPVNGAGADAMVVMEDLEEDRMASTNENQEEDMEDVEKRSVLSGIRSRTADAVSKVRNAFATLGENVGRLMTRDEEENQYLGRLAHDVIKPQIALPPVTKKIFFVRNGKSEDEIALETVQQQLEGNQFQNALRALFENENMQDGALVNKGIEQACMLRRHDEIVNKAQLVVSAARTKALQTAYHALGKSGIKMIASDLFNEQSGLALFEKRKNKSDLEKEFPAFHFYHVEEENDPIWKLDTVEPDPEFKERIFAAVRFLFAQPEDNIVVFTHAIWMKTLFKIPLEELREDQSYPINTEIFETVLTMQGSNLTVAEFSRGDK